MTRCRWNVGPIDAGGLHAGYLECGEPTEGNTLNEHLRHGGRPPEVLSCGHYAWEHAPGRNPPDGR